MLKKLKKGNEGFTLVELIVVIAILAVLSMLIVPRILENVEEARKDREIANARTLASEITVYNGKQTVDTDKIQDNNPGDTYVNEAEYEDKLDLPTGITWPDEKYVKIPLDADGNASIELITPTP